MISSNMKVKSVLLALAMVVAMPSQSAESQTVNKAANEVVTAFISFVKNNKMLVGFVTGTTTAMLVRLWTKPRPEEAYKFDQWKNDRRKFLKSFDIFNTKLYKKLVHLFDKWIIGLEVKIEETKTKTKNEDGSVFIINGKKLIQKPFGAVGLIDAYVLKQIKKTTDLIPLVVLFSLLLLEPDAVLQKVTNNATK